MDANKKSNLMLDKSLIYITLLVSSLLVLQNFIVARTAGKFFWYTEELFSSDTCQTIKRPITAEICNDIYSQMKIA